MSQSPANWESLKVLVADALERPVDQREQFLVEACGSDVSMLDEARAMVAAYEGADGVLDRRTDAWLGLGGPDLLALGGQKFGRYTLEKLLAEGAMAAVYLARQTHPRRQVALKLVRATLPLTDATARFKRESAALGRLEHPNIARIYDAGVHRAPSSAGVPSAMPYIAMEYVDGLPITEYARQRALSRADRIRLMIKVAHAVHAAHQQAVIHRDLKPANVLVESSSGEPKVLDFGIARIVGGDDAENYTWQTTAGVLLGTPGYMSPEQAAGRVGEVDVRSDVWALGVMLYELLTDRLPIDVRHTSIAEVLRRIETFDPPPLGRIDPSLRGDLETIVAAALARDKRDRYASAQSLADDLRRVLDDEPISVRPPSRWYRARKFVRRHRVGVTMAGAFAALLLAATVVSSIGFVQARRQRDIAVSAEARANAVNTFLRQMLQSADTNLGGTHDLTVLQAIRNAEKNIAGTFADDPLAEAGVREAIGYTLYSLSQYDEARPQMQRAVDLYRQQLGAADRRTLDAANYLVTIMRWQYRPDDALLLLNQALPIAIDRFGRGDPTTLALLDNAAGAAHDKGQYQAARDAYVELLELCRNSPAVGPDGDMSMTVMNNLSLVLTDSGDYAQAEALLRELIATRARRQGMTTISQLTSRGNLAFVLNISGRPREAEEILRPLLEDAQRVLGPSHDHTLSVLTALANALHRQGRSDESLPLAKEVAARHADAHGEDDVRTLRARGNLAADLIDAGRVEEALPIIRHTAERFVQMFGPDHLETFRARNILAKALQESGAGDQAEAIWLEMIRRTAQQHGPDSYEHMLARTNLAHLYLGLNRPSEALAIGSPVLESAEKHADPILPATLLRHLGSAALAVGDTTTAEDRLTRSVSMLTEAKSDPMAVTRSVEALARFYETAGRFEEARRWRETVATRPATQPATEVDE